MFWIEKIQVSTGPGSGYLYQKIGSTADERPPGTDEKR